MKFIFLLAAIFISLGDCFSQSIEHYCTVYQKSLSAYNQQTLYSIDKSDFDLGAFKEDFIQSLDPHAIIFSYSDLALLDSLLQFVRDDYLTSYCRANNDLFDIYRKSINGTITNLEELKNGHFDYTLYEDDHAFMEGFKIDKKSRCQTYLASSVLYSVLSAPVDGDALAHREALLGLLNKEKSKYLERQVNLYKSLLNNPDKLHQMILSGYLNSLLAQYDPYAYYFSKDAFRKFKEELSTNPSKFGFQLREEQPGELVIAKLIPGSSAWKTGRINPGDRVIKLESNDNGAIDLTQATMQQIETYLSNLSSDRLDITLQKADNSVRQVKVYREKLERTENSVQAFVLQGAQRVGYINLPAFYTSWESERGFGCAQDVGRAIYQLKKENIESLIIDLRNNGGGAISEAIDLAGIFIDFGTLAVARNKENVLTSVRDFNRGTLYNGPMAVLVNANSASASEMVAAVLQDYNRAIIVGDTTVGKSTGQILLPVNEPDKSMLKLTTSEFFRVTGTTYNQQGIVPDITLPGHAASWSAKGRRAYPHMIKTINRKNYYKALPNFPIDILGSKSLKRQRNSLKFKLIGKMDSIYLNWNRQMSQQAFDLDAYHELLVKKYTLNQQVDSIFNKKSKQVTPNLLPSDRNMTKMSKYYENMYREAMHVISTDPYIEETYNILIDYSNLKTDSYE